MTTRTTATAGRPRKRTAGTRPSQRAPGVGTLLTLAQQVRGWADSFVSMAAPAADLAMAAAGARTQDPKQRATIKKAGSTLRRMRESAGLTLQQVTKALDLRDPEWLESAEMGSVVLPFEVILRLAAVLGRDDPVSTMMRLTRAYNPDLWKTLERLGVGRLAVQAGRERELANVYRGNDGARRLDDAQFARVLQFTRQAFDMAVQFHLKPRSTT